MCLSAFRDYTPFPWTGNLGRCFLEPVTVPVPLLCFPGCVAGTHFVAVCACASLWTAAADGVSSASLHKVSSAQVDLI